MTRSLPRLRKQVLPRKYASSWLNRRVLNSNLKTEALESTYQRALDLLAVAAVEVVCSEIAIRLMILEHMKQDD